MIAYSISIFILIILFVLLILLLRNYNKLQKYKKVEFPFKNLYDQNNNIINIIAIGAPFRNKTHDDLYQKYKKLNYEFIGISSYQQFPGSIDNPYEDKYHINNNHNYEKLVKTWLHCFRDPSKYFKTNIPKMLMSESDFKDINQYAINPKINKKYDFIYVCLKDNDNCTSGWQSYNRNWDLAKKCLYIMCTKYKLKGLIIGREKCIFTNSCNKFIEVISILPFNEFQIKLQESRFIFLPNINDASPRVLVEAMCYNLPCLVNYKILGGWKYVNSKTGEFFNDEKDLSKSLDKLLNNFSKYIPREYYSSNYGINISGKILRDFIKKHYTLDENISLITIR